VLPAEQRLVNDETLRGLMSPTHGAPPGDETPQLAEDEEKIVQRTKTYARQVLAMMLARKL